MGFYLAAQSTETATESRSAARRQSHLEAKTPIEAPFSHTILSAKYWDADTKLMYYGYRYLSPGMGRWANRDPLTDSIYFDGNDAINNVDYLGLFTINDSVENVPWTLKQQSEWDVKTGNRFAWAFTDPVEGDLLVESTPGVYDCNCRFYIKEYSVTYKIHVPEDNVVWKQWLQTHEEVHVQLFKAVNRKLEKSIRNKACCYGKKVDATFCKSKVESVKAAVGKVIREAHGKGGHKTLDSGETQFPRVFVLGFIVRDTQATVQDLIDLG